ncbi:MAG: hypothetical protein V2A59_02560 [Candidatus Omnitrophota bacterium]
MLKLKALYSILTRLSKREKIILYGAALFMFLVLLDRMIIYPVFHRLESLDEEIKQKEYTVRKNIHILAQKDKILSESAKYAPFLSSLKSEEEEISSLLKEVETQANKASVYLVDLKPAGSKDIGTSKKYLVNLNCEAQMEQVISFMYNIENSNKLLIIEKYQITPKSRDSSVAKCSLTISKIAMP